MAPSFSQELFDLIIDESASKGREEWPYLPKCDDCEGYGFRNDEDPIRTLLKSCSLVSKSWYSRASKHLWRGVTIIASHHSALRSLRSVLTGNLELVTLVKHVALHAKLPLGENEASLQALSCLLAPTTSFMLICHGRGWRHVFEAGSWNEDQPFIRTITPFCHADRLTSLFYDGRYFPTKLLAGIPNLRDFTLHSSHSSDPRIIHPLTFRLKRAHFSELSNAVYGTLIRGAPQIFCQLEELIFRETVGDDEWVDEDCSAQIVLLAKDTVRQVYIGKSSPITYLRHLFSKGAVVFPSLTHLTFKLDALYFEDEHWEALQTHLGTSVLCPNLEHLDVFVNYVMFGDFVKLKEPNHIIWTTMHKYLGPDQLPALREIDIGMTYTDWSKSEYYESLGQYDYDDEDDEVAKEVKAEVVRQCLPTWEGDTRAISIRFSSENFYEDPRDYD